MFTIKEKSGKPKSWEGGKSGSQLIQQFFRSSGLSDSCLYSLNFPVFFK
jgi:hypothetical protein